MTIIMSYVHRCITLDVLTSAADDSYDQPRTNMYLCSHPLFALGRALGLVVRAAGCHAGEPGSILCRGDLYTFGCTPQRFESALAEILSYIKAFYLSKSLGLIRNVSPLWSSKLMRKLVFPKVAELLRSVAKQRNACTVVINSIITAFPAVLTQTPSLLVSL
jgi:hypothetical protein